MALLVYNVKSYGAAGNGAVDDTTAIQAAITAAQTAGGGVVFFPQGTYPISATLICSADNIEVVGAGWGSQILAKPTLSGYMLQVQGPGGAGNFRYGISIADIFFNGNNVAGVQGIDLVSCYASLVDHIRMRYVPGINLHYDGISGAFGAYNYLNDSHITDGGATAVGVQTDNSEWLMIKGGLFGYFSGGTAVAVMLQNLNNRVIGTGFDHNDIAVQCNFAGRNVIQGCQFDRGYTNFIYLRGAAYCAVEGNVFCTSSGGTDLIKVSDSNNAGNVVSGNTCTASTWTNFVNEVANTGATTPNQYSSNQIGSYGVVRASNSGIFRNNPGLNPRGAAVTQPAVPASTTPLTNTTGFDCMVLVSGGTVTQIAIGGTNTGQISGWFRVPALQTITLTYSVAPTTFAWWGD